MSISNVVIFDFNKTYSKFLIQIKKDKLNYSLKYFFNSPDIQTNFKFKKFKQKLLDKNIKILIFCSKKSLKILMKHMDFFIKKKIKIVQASTNHEIENHGFIIRKPFKDFAFDELFLRKTLKLNNNSISKMLFNKKVLITGGAGSIGTFLVKSLIKFNLKKIYIIDNNEHNIFKLLNNIEYKNLLKKIQVKIINIENFEIIDPFFKKKKPDIVFHTAALKHVNFLEDNVHQAVKTNVIGTENVLQAANNSNVKYFIHVSTDKAANPKNVLGITKFISEIKCSKYLYKGLKIAIVRFGNVFNSNGSVAEKFRSNLIKTKKIYISDPNVNRFFMSGNEASSLIISALEIIYKSISSVKCRTFVCDMGQPIKILDIAKKMIFLSGRSPEKYLSKTYLGLPKQEKIEENLISKNEKIINFHNNKIFEIRSDKSFLKIKKYDFNKLLNIKSSASILKLIKNFITQ